MNNKIWGEDICNLNEDCVPNSKIVYTKEIIVEGLRAYLDIPCYSRKDCVGNKYKCSQYAPTTPCECVLDKQCVDYIKRFYNSKLSTGSGENYAILESEEASRYM